MLQKKGNMFKFKEETIQNKSALKYIHIFKNKLLDMAKKGKEIDSKIKTLDQFLNI